MKAEEIPRFYLLKMVELLVLSLYLFSRFCILNFLTKIRLVLNSGK